VHTGSRVNPFHEIPDKKKFPLVSVKQNIQKS